MSYTSVQNLHELSIDGDGSTMVSNQPLRQKIYLRIDVPSEDSDKTAHSRSESSLGAF